MSKIGIITYHDSDNYGSVLQAYALATYINKYRKCEVIDYRKPEVEKLYRIFKPMTSKYNIITNIYRVFSIVKYRKRKRNFEEFREKELHKSKQIFHTKGELAEQIKNYDKIIVGSDQVWNYDIVDFDTSYMLDFPQYEGSRIAYAVSCGPISKSYDSIKPYKPLIDRFDVITVRDEETFKVVSGICNKHIEMVMDPVFLLDKQEWERIGNKSSIEPEKKYVFCYFPGGILKNIEKYSRQLSKDMGCERVLIESEWRNIFRKGKKFYDCSVYDFIKLINNAECVVTTSFHAVAFSIILNKKFRVAYGNGVCDTRISSLLTMSGDTDSLVFNKIDRADKTCLKEETQKSKDFLQRLL